MTALGDEDLVMFEGPLEAEPERVWRALTVPALMSAWLLPADGEGESLRLDGEPENLPPIACEVIEAEAPSLLRYRWQADGEEMSVVTFELTRISGGTWLRLTHEPAPALALALTPANTNAPLMHAA